MNAIGQQASYWYQPQQTDPDARSIVSNAKARLATIERQLAAQGELEKEAKQLRAMIEAAERAIGG